MRKILILLIVLFLPINVFASSKERVEFYKCVDGDTARFIRNNKEIKVRFLGIDAPEYSSKIEPLGKESTDYVCSKLKKAKKIELEYEPSSNKKDNYGRYLAYVFVDGNLLEESIIKNGYAKVKYLNSNYKYFDNFKKAEEKAINKKIGVYSDTYDKNEDVEFKNAKKDVVDALTNFFDKYIKRILSNIFERNFN